MGANMKQLKLRHKTQKLHKTERKKYTNITM